MVTLFDGLRSAANSLRTTGEALSITQMNLTNGGVSGYARQSVNLTSDGFDPSRNMPGGVSGSSTSARNQYAEQAVWSQTSKKGFYDSFNQSANGVDSLLGLTDPASQTGIKGALATLFQSFSQLLQGASDPVNQQNVIQRARGFALTVSQAADFIGQSNAIAQSAVQTTVDQINGLVGDIKQWNSQLHAGTEIDPIAEAQVYSKLETLSTLVPITVQKDPKLGISILLNGQIPLLQGTIQSPLSVSFAAPGAGAAFQNAPAELQIRTAANEDVTSSITNGELGGLLDYTNHFVPTLLGNADQEGDLNRLAQGVAASVNAALGGGTPLFNFGDTNPANAGRTLQVFSTFSNADLTAAVAANPAALNNLNAIAGGTSAANQLDGQSYSQFTVVMASRSATQLTSAKDGVALQATLLNQAKGFRDSVQGASVEQSAVELLQLQRAFEAAAKVIGIIDQLTQTTIELVR